MCSHQTAKLRPNAKQKPMRNASVFLFGRRYFIQIIIKVAPLPSGFPRSRTPCEGTHAHGGHLRRSRIKDISLIMPLVCALRGWPSQPSSRRLRTPSDARHSNPRRLAARHFEQILRRKCGTSCNIENQGCRVEHPAAQISRFCAVVKQRSCDQTQKQKPMRNASVFLFG